MTLLIKAFWRSLSNIFHDITIDIAGYIAYMSFLALFPFLILLMLLAGYIGTLDAAQLTIQEIYQVLPQEVVKEIAPIITEVTERPQGGIITIAIIAILWISSSSVEAFRLGLNHAYDLKENRSFFSRRLQSLIFVLLGALSFLIAVGILIILPVLLKLWQLIETYLPYVPDLPGELGAPLNLIRVVAAYTAVLVWITLNYKWLPHHKITLAQCLPGALIASFLWIIAAGLFSIYLQNLARYDILYGSLGGVVITLVFFHISATLILLGGHINKELKR